MGVLSRVGRAWTAAPLVEDLRTSTLLLCQGWLRLARILSQPEVSPASITYKNTQSNVTLGTLQMGRCVSSISIP
ncbi:hypothetical protein GE061_003239 [Apolygus lucorum]|uniref:Uncharacterized protein n=1 Tax=Apolygus lucorum TaxID=248454 RepID=A0A8S9X2Z8_APOLU|nr:hypothetical protein GE061_003239 [Apolygus lucorum]